MATFGTSPLGPKTGSFQWEMASTLPRCFVLATVGSNQTRHHSVLTLHCGDAPQWRGAGPRKRTGYKPSVGRGLRCPPFSGFDPTYIPFFSSATCPFLFGRRFLFFCLLRVSFQRAPVAPNPMVFFFLGCLCGPCVNRPLLSALVWGRR